MKNDNPISDSRLNPVIQYSCNINIAYKPPKAYHNWKDFARVDSSKNYKKQMSNFSDICFPYLINLFVIFHS